MFRSLIKIQAYIYMHVRFTSSKDNLLKIASNIGNNLKYILIQMHKPDRSHILFEGVNENYRHISYSHKLFL